MDRNTKLRLLLVKEPCKQGRLLYPIKHFKTKSTLTTDALTMSVSHCVVFEM